MGGADAKCVTLPHCDSKARRLLPTQISISKQRLSCLLVLSVFLLACWFNYCFQIWRLLYVYCTVCSKGCARKRWIRGLHTTRHTGLKSKCQTSVSLLSKTFATTSFIPASLPLPTSSTPLPLILLLCKFLVTLLPTLSLLCHKSLL